MNSTLLKRLVFGTSPVADQHLTTKPHFRSTSLLRMRLPSVVAGIAAAIYCEVTQVHAAMIIALGDLPGGRFESGANSVSADGKTVVGYSEGPNGNQAFRWTSGLGMVPFDDLPGGYVPLAATGVSHDGTTIVGDSGMLGGTDRVAYRWTSSGGMTRLLPGGNVQTEAAGVSANGETVVGSLATNVREAYRWTTSGGMVGLGNLPQNGERYSVANAVSEDGNTVVGKASASRNDRNVLEAFLWTSGNGMVGLGDLPGGNFNSEALDVSGDGSTVVGHSLGANGSEAFRWTSSGGMVGLGTLPGVDSVSIARAVSRDGSIIVGTSSESSVVWTQAQGMVSLYDYLILNRVDLAAAGWTALRYASDISPDGRWVTGFGVHNGQNEAFLVDLQPIPEPSTILGGVALSAVALREMLRRRRT